MFRCVGIFTFTLLLFVFSLIATQNKTKLSWVKTGQHHIIFNILGKTTKRGGRERMIRKTWFFNCWDLKQKIVDKFRARGWATWWSHRERFISEDHELVTASHLFIKQHTDAVSPPWRLPSSGRLLMSLYLNTFWSQRWITHNPLDTDRQWWADADHSGTSSVLKAI